MTAQSKYLVSYPGCCEIVHRFEPSCDLAAASIILPTLKNAFRVYSFVYLVLCFKYTTQSG